MKKYPKNLIDAIVLAEVAEYLYERAESFETQAEEYKERLKAEGEETWLAEYICKAEASMNAYIRLAEKLTK